MSTETFQNYTLNNNFAPRRKVLYLFHCSFQEVDLRIFAGKPYAIAFQERGCSFHCAKSQERLFKGEVRVIMIFLHNYK